MAEAALKLAESDPFAVADVSLETQRAVEQFLYRQAEILDEKQWDDWLALFTEDGHYWMPANEDDTTGHRVPAIFWEDHDIMTMRIRRNSHPRAHSQAPHNRLNHVVSNVIIESEDANGDVVVAGIPGEEATVKVFRSEGADVVLVPANPTLTEMRFAADEVTIYGRVVTVLRKL